LPGGAFGQRPLYLTYPPDGTNRVVVVDQNGRISIFPNDPNVASVSTFLDLTGRVGREGNEEGLLGLAFHPHYSENGFVYVYYTAYNPRRSVISRFKISSAANRLDPASESIVMEVAQPFANHNGGMLAFGPDSLLYIGLGDGGSANDPQRNGQNLGVLLGKILRIDVDRQESGRVYAIPADNPFVSQPGARGEIWAYGLRNPWRFSFDRATGTLWAGDVGQGRLEEVDIIRRGLNYGWNIMEGTSCLSGTACNRAGLEPPIAEYGRDKGCSITGGYVYRGPSLIWLRGAYLYSDFCSGRIWAVRHDGTRVTEERELASTGRSVASFGEDAAGKVYLLAFDGNVYRMRAAS
jgi:glucose/arabinose dehydrogenase